MEKLLREHRARVLDQSAFAESIAGANAPSRNSSSVCTPSRGMAPARAGMPEWANEKSVVSEKWVEVPASPKGEAAGW